MVTYSKIISTVGKVALPSLLWNFNIEDKTIYLTFDDGPIPDVTPWVLQQLNEYDAKATFFCIGENIAKNPDIFKLILEHGHAVGNHSYNHLNGWKTNNKVYVENVLKAERKIQELNTRVIPHQDSTVAKMLFRPPYGRITLSQIQELERHDYKIIMWDVISGDYDRSKTPKACFEDVKKHTRPGSILVFHDSIKAFKNLQVVLPKVLRYFTEEGFEFKSL